MMESLSFMQVLTGHGATMTQTLHRGGRGLETDQPYSCLGPEDSIEMMGPEYKVTKL